MSLHDDASIQASSLYHNVQLVRNLSDQRVLWAAMALYKMDLMDRWCYLSIEASFEVESCHNKGRHILRLALCRGHENTLGGGHFHLQLAPAHLYVAGCC